MSPDCKYAPLYVNSSVNCARSIRKELEHSIPVPLEFLASPGGMSYRLTENGGVYGH
jgi:hypothetical protein